MNPRQQLDPLCAAARRISPTMTGRAALVLLALSTPHALAQQFFETSFGRGYHLTPHGVSLPGSFSRGAVGHFQTDGLPDFVWVKGSGAQMMISPGLFDAPVDDALESINDVDVWPTAPVATVVTVEPLGLFSTVWISGMYDWRRTLVAEGPWVGARRVAAARAGRTNTGVLFGVGADGVSVLRFEPGTPTQTEVLAVCAQPIEELTVADWDHDGDDDVVVAGAGWLAVYPGDGGAPPAPLVPLHVIDPAVTIGLATGTSAQGGDFVAWCTAAPAGHGELRIARLGAALAGPYEIEGLPFGGVAVGGLDASGLHSIVVTGRDTNLLFILHNFGDATAPSFGPQNGAGWYRAIAATGPWSWDLLGAGQPLLADIDGDGDEDLGVPAGEEGTMLFMKNGLVDEKALTPRVRRNGVTHEGDQHDMLLTAQQELEMTIMHAQAIPAGANAIEARWWYMAEPNGDLDPYSLQGRFWRFDPLDPPPPETSILFEMDLAQYLDSGSSSTPPPYFDGLFFGVLRYVTLNANGSVVDVFPGQPIGVEAEWASSGGPHEQWLAENFLATPHSPWDLHIDTGIGVLFAGEPDEIGTGGPGECVPCKQNCPPDTGWFDPEG